MTLAVSQIEGMRRARGEHAYGFTSATSKAQPPAELMSEYVVDPPDLVLVELLEGLPGRPISGERLVRPNGTISLGWYGDVYVAGLTVPEVKEKIVKHLRKYLQDEELGLIKLDEETGEWIKDANGEPVPIDPKESDRVFVDVTAYNSKYYYVQGEFETLGKLPITGHERVLDAIDYSNGLTSNADHDQVFLYRQPADGGPVQTMKIDVDQILLGDDLSTNHHLQPGDRLVARRRGGDAARCESRRRVRRHRPPNRNSRPVLDRARVQTARKNRQGRTREDQCMLPTCPASSVSRSASEIWSASSTRFSIHSAGRLIDPAPVWTKRNDQILGNSPCKS